MPWFWLGGAVLMAVAAAAVWFAFQRPDFVARLVSVAAGALWKALAPSLAPRDLTLEERAKERRGENAFDMRRGKRPSSK